MILISLESAHTVSNSIDDTMSPPSRRLTIPTHRIMGRSMVWQTSGEKRSRRNQISCLPDAMILSPRNKR